MEKKRLQVAVGVIKNTAGQVLLALRDKSVHQGGLWEFPGGKLEAGESAYPALVRELREELAIEVTMASPLITINHQYPERAVQLLVYEVTGFSGQPRGNEGQPLRWVDPSDLQNFAFPAANRPIITAAQLPNAYAILEADHGSQLLANLHSIIAHGVKLVQIRVKSLPRPMVNEFLEQAYPLCQQHGVSLLANSALGIESHPAFTGIHLTGNDLLNAKQRPKFTWVGASCHSLAELRHAEKLGVDFAVLAPVLPTMTHPDYPALGWEQFAEWVAEVNFPIYALGGMQRSLLDRARQAGGQGIASIRAFIN